MEETIDEWMYEHARISTKVKAALAAYALQNGEPMYELHVICGVNDAVSGPEYCASSRRHTPLIYHRTHLNFLASRNIDQCAEQVRCLYCDHQGIRVVHPAVGEFHGRELEFEKMVCQQDLYNEYFDPKFAEQFHTNEKIVSYSNIIAKHVIGLEEDCIYLKFAGSDDDTDDEGNSCDDDTTEEDDSDDYYDFDLE